MPETDYLNARTWTRLNAAAGAHDQWSLPDAARAVSVTVHPGAGGSATLSVTCSPAEDVDAGNAAWVDVSIGGNAEQNAAAGTELSPAVTAIRLGAVTAAAVARIAVLV